MSRARGARAAALLVATAVVACAAPPPPAPEAPTGLGRAAGVERVRFHGVSDPALARRVRALLADRVAGDPDAAHAARSLALDLQLVGVEVRRRLRAVGVATLGLGDGAWRVESRVFGRLRVHDAAGCRVAEVQAHHDDRGRAGFGDPAPLPAEDVLRALVDRLVALARRRLEIAGAPAGRGAPCRRHAARGILAASRNP